MSKLVIIGLSVVLGIVGIALATLVFGPLGYAFWSELAKFFPAIIVSIIAYYFAQSSKEKAEAAVENADRAALEARAGRQETELARQDAEAAMSKRARKRVEQARGQL